MNNKFSLRDQHIMAHGRNIEKFYQIIKDKQQMIMKLESEIEEIENLIAYNKNIDEKLGKEDHNI